MMIAAAAGYPHITVPAGYVHGVPVGISLLGTAWSEPTLIKLAGDATRIGKHRDADHEQNHQAQNGHSRRLIQVQVGCAQNR